MGRSAGKRRISKKTHQSFSLVPESQKQALNKAFISGRLYPLDKTDKISSSHGIYGIFYISPEEKYKKLLDDPRKDPIYIGKAGISGLATRLSQHKKSIEEAGMNPDCFRCRFLEIESEADTFAAEIILQEMHKPLWNTILKGFGNKNVGKARSGQIRSRWDTFHTGRGWARDMTDRKESKVRIEKEMLLFYSFKKEKLSQGGFGKKEWLDFLYNKKDQL